MTALLTLKNITTGYGKKRVLHKISFRLDKGEIAVLIGSNGAGKSTVLRAIYGLNLLWSNGEIIFNGERINGLPPEKIIQKGIIYIPQKDNTFTNMTVIENLQTSAWSLDKYSAQDRIEEVLELFSELGRNRNKLAQNLSGGQRQLLALSMGLIHKPKLVLFDEPSAGLDAKRARQIFDIISQLKSDFQVSSLIVEHRVKAASQIADNLIGLKLGRLHETLDTKNALTNEEMKDLFM